MTWGNARSSGTSKESIADVRLRWTKPPEAGTGARVSPPAAPRRGSTSASKTAIRKGLSTLSADTSYRHSSVRVTWADVRAGRASIDRGLPTAAPQQGLCDRQYHAVGFWQLVVGAAPPNCPWSRCWGWLTGTPGALNVPKQAALVVGDRRGAGSRPRPAELDLKVPFPLVTAHRQEVGAARHGRLLWVGCRRCSRTGRPVGRSL